MEESFILCATLVGRYCSAWAEFPKVFLQICVCLHRPTDRSSVHFFSMTSAIFEEDNSLSLFHSFLYFLAKLLFVQKWEGKKVFIWRLVDHLYFRYSTFFSKNIHLIGAWRILPKQHISINIDCSPRYLGALQNKDNETRLAGMRCGGPNESH